MDDNYKFPMQKYTWTNDVKNKILKSDYSVGMSGKWIYLVSISLFFYLNNFFLNESVGFYR